ncbi:FAD dependent oxidoreductase [Zychaea mexicana]|uniref:FAD dependent oxidoreductase n=1 Tax=Zychaea mexicana TaxID=64656 RepID=UPI0022FDC0E9|nr:FAD dependent oxidoreductase [Zychaea mexicana]KAI9497846.1 FAD dependent oxidoreductase [Zychaea mexicana]
MSLLRSIKASVPQFQRAFSTIKIPDMEVDNLVIGAGVIGLAIGEKLTRERPSETTIVVDKNKRCGEETSSRNSEVIHAGIYYPKDSLKTQLCIQGKNLMYSLLSHTNIPYNKIGKLVVAQTGEQQSYLQELHDKSNELGVETRMLTGDETAAMEPEVKACASLLSPTTGIIDSHLFMDYLEQQIVQNGGDLGLYTSAMAIQPCTEGGDGYIVDLATPPGSAEVTTVLAKRVFNAAGLHADKVSNLLLGDKYKLHYGRGFYYAYNGPVKVNHLIYPCPAKNLAGLGTHLTVDMAGKIKFGPDIHYIDDPYDYNVPDDSNDRQRFAEAVRSFMPHIDPNKLHPDYAGIRYWKEKQFSCSSLVMSRKFISQCYIFLDRSLQDLVSHLETF